MRPWVHARPRAPRLRRRPPPGTVRAGHRGPPGARRPTGSPAPRPPSGSAPTLRWGKRRMGAGRDARPWPVQRGRPDARVPARRRAASWACSRSTPAPGPGWTASSGRPPRRWTGRPRSSRCSATPVARRSPARAPAHASPTSTRRGPRSPGRVATPSCPASPRRPSAGSWRTRGRSCGASAAAAAATTGSCSIRRATAMARGAWQIEEHLAGAARGPRGARRARGRRSSCSAPTRPGYDGDRLAALVREHFGVAGDRRADAARQPRGVPAAAGRLGAQPGPLTPADAAPPPPRRPSSPARRTRASVPRPRSATGGRATRPG